MRTAAFVVLGSLLVVSLVPMPATAAPVYERTGHYRAASGISFYTDACATANYFAYRDNVDSTCSEFTRDLTGLMMSVRDEGLFAPATQKLRVCFYSDYNVIIVCPDTYTGCEAGFAYCARIPANAKYYGVSSATGVDVYWHAVVN